MSRASLLTALCAWAAVVGCSSGGSDPVVSDPESGVFAGKIVDDDGNAVVGAFVSVDGVAADSPTDGEGNFVVSDSELSAEAAVASGANVALAQTHEITVLASGFQPIAQTWSTAAGSVATIEIVRRALEPDLTLVTPTADDTLVVSNACGEPRVRVTGIVDLVVQDSFLLDIVLVVDSSGSTEDPAFDVDGDEEIDSVLDVEKEAVSCFLDTVDFDSTRVALVSFGDSATQLVGLSRSRETLETGLESIGLPTGGTNYEAAFSLAEQVFVEQEVTDAENEGPAEEGGDEEALDRRRVVIFLTDGIPTAHGVPRDTTDSNVDQSADDRAGAIEAARALGDSTSAELYGYIVVEDDETSTKFTTLPHCVAVSGGGRYATLESEEDIASELCAEALVEEVVVEVRNATLGGDAVTAEIGVGGHFEAGLPVSAATDGSGLVNEIVVTATAFPGDLDVSVEATVSVTVLGASLAETLDVEDLVDARRAPQPVSQKNFLTAPHSGRIRNDVLYDLLVGDDAQYEDAVELFGVETFNTFDADGGVPGTVEITVDFIHNRACYRSDVGYVVVDPDDLPETAEEALADADPDENVLFNTTDIVGLSCDYGTVDAGDARYEVEIPTGQVVILFILPNRTLENFQANPNSGNRPLFTLASLNPRGLTQALAFVSDDGRTEAGASEVVVTPGPVLIVGFEDITLASRGSDSDYDDVVLSIGAGVVPRLDSILCDD